MYNDNNPNNFEQDPNRQENGLGIGQENPGENVERQSQYPYHNYYADRYRREEDNRGRQDSYQGYRPTGGNAYPPKKPNKGGRIAVATILVAVFAVFCVGLSWLAVSSLQEQIANSKTSQDEEVQTGQTEGEEAGSESEVAKEPDQNPAGGSEDVDIRESGQVTAVVTDVTDVVEKVMPACVSITNQFTSEFEDFWGQVYSQDESASGSGIIIGQNDTEILIVTNWHVVDKTDTLYVQFIDGETLEAQLKGADASVDLAVIAVALEDIGESTRNAICIAQMGDSDNLKIGEPAIAIGNALGYGQSVTTGVVSALNRTPEMSELGSSGSLIQTDAAINPGNSGGALLNLKGEVIGINSSKIGNSLVEGMGYAIPISTARPIIESLMARETKGKVSEEERGYLGISCINVTSDLSENFDLPQGVFVAQVYEGTGAAEAGLVRGDIITAFDGVTVRNQQELTDQMLYYKAGETVEITIMQGSPSGYQEKKIQLTLCSQQQLDQAGRR